MRSNNLSLKYQSFPPLWCADIGIEIMSLRRRLNYFENSTLGGVLRIEGGGYSC